MGEIKKPKFDWYETDEQIFLNILVKQIDPENIEIRFEPNKLYFFYRQPSKQLSQEQNSPPLELNLNLNGEIVPSKCKWKVSSVKVEIKMCKILKHRWGNLEVINQKQVTDLKSVNSCPAVTKDRDKMKTWDKIVKDFEKENEKDDGITALFQKIYATGDENVRRAMNKSFIESNGTVLSTNWNDVGKGKVEMKEPDNCEYKKYNQ